MGLFGNAIKSVTNRVSGKTDALEAAIAAGIIIAASEGGISDDEAATLLDTLMGMDFISQNFTQSQVEEVCEAYVKRAKTGVGRAALLKELDDVAQKSIDIRENAFLVAAEVARADGTIGDQERAALNKVAARLGVEVTKLMAI
jgi:tellurite resistance protein